ncbi:hypothetical protein EST55_02605 [Idiomarina sp. 29L]|uniref:YdbH domain-containing protein n=1 Tax=Idiomarina sp. 29L TaxID=2508877 RepID=UPI0010120C92|nr:YdbH domain-containing protein [Idiomarina sp. 29L]RXS44387.1 hypothetical protein EST55_02605 [Idiomarina sp. 29L]
MPNTSSRVYRLLAITGSTVLTLALFIGIALLIGLSIADRKLAKAGIEDWSISIGSLSEERVVIEQLSVTMSELPSSSTSNSNATPTTIKELLNTPIPNWLPEVIVIKNITLKGGLLTQYAPIIGELKLDTKRQNVSLHLLQPEALNVNLSRNNSTLSADITHSLGSFNANYGFSTGQWDIKGSAKVPTKYLAQAAGFVKSEQIALSLSADGSLSPETEMTGAESLISAISGKLTVSLQQPINVTSPGVASVETLVSKGDVGLDFNRGVIENYALKLSGELTQWPSLPLEISSVKWQFASQDTLTLEPLNYQQLFSKTEWPVQLSLAVEGEDISGAQLTMAGHVMQLDAQFVRLSLPKTRLTADKIITTSIDALDPLTLDSLNKLDLNTDIMVEHDQVMFYSEQPSSLFIKSHFANANFLISTFSAAIPFTTPNEATVKLSTKINNVAIKVEELESLKPKLSHRVQYKGGSIKALGTIELAQGTRLNHHSTLTPTQDLVSNVDVNLDDLTQTELQSQLSPLLQNTLPLLTLDKGGAKVGLKLSGNLKTGQWRIDEGEVDLNNVSAIYDTTSVTNANLNANFTANSEHLNLQQADLSLATIQQGFTIGPVSAELAAKVPYKNQQNSTVTLKNHSIKALGGSVRIPEQIYDFSEPLRIPVVFERINLGELMRQYPTNRIAIDGNVSGTIPLLWDSQQLTVEKGYLSAVAPGGHLKVDSSALRSAVGSNPSLKTLASVLEDFYYQELSSVVGYDKNGELTLELQLNGYNPAVENGRKVKLNVTLEEDLPALIKGIQLSNSVSDVIRKRIQQRVN